MKIDLNSYIAHDLPIDKLDTKPTEGEGRYHLIISDCIMSLDTETTSYYINEKGAPVLFDKSNPKMMIDKRTPMARGSILYHWQMMIDGNYFSGRTCKSFRKFIGDLKDTYQSKGIERVIIFIHNLGFDFHALLLNTFDTWSDGSVFARETHHPIYCSPDDFFEFRCSFQLSMLSLATMGKEIGLPKASGDLDYNQLRTPLTPLTEQEQFYCRRDCEVLDRWLLKVKRKYGHVYKIPLTLTGETRVELKSLFKPLKDYTELCWKLNKISYRDSEFLLRTMHGGCVFASPAYKDITIDAAVNPMIMKDIASSYPWVLISQPYPLTKFKTIHPSRTEEIEEVMMDATKSYIIEFECDDLITQVPPLFLSGTYLQDLDKHSTCLINGRVYSAEHAHMTMTNVDFGIFRRCYTYKNLKIKKFKYAINRWLPDDFCRFIIECYKNKTRYKDVTGMESIYQKSKMIINALYGIFAQKHITPEIYFDPDIGWTKEDVTDHIAPDGSKVYASEVYEHKLDALLWGETKEGRKYKKRLYTCPQVGCWVTSYARASLWAGILGRNNKNASYVVYSDTDSIKQLDWEHAEDVYKWYNGIVMEQHKEIADRLGIDVEELSPKDPKGRKRPIGIFAGDGECTEFRTLGSKKYIYRDKEDGNLHMTLAGVPKSCVKELNDDINNFKKGFTFFPTVNDAEDLSIKQKLAPVYLYSQKPVIFPDGYYHNDRFGVCLMPVAYELDTSRDDTTPEEFLKTILNLTTANPLYHFVLKIREEDDEYDD